MFLFHKMILFLKYDVNHLRKHDNLYLYLILLNFNIEILLLKLLNNEFEVMLYIDVCKNIIIKY